MLPLFRVSKHIRLCIGMYTHANGKRYNHIVNNNNNDNNKTPFDDHFLGFGVFFRYGGGGGGVKRGVLVYFVR